MALWSKVPLVTLVPIRNMNRAITFYTKTLGADVTERGRGQMRNFWAKLTIGPNEVWLVGGSKPEKRELAYSMFQVKNIRKVVKKLKERGVKFQRPERMNARTKIEGPIAWESFGGAAFFADSEGNVFMIWQDLPSM